MHSETIQTEKLVKLKVWELEKYETLKLKTAEQGQIIEMVSKNKKQRVQNWLFTDKLAWPKWIKSAQRAQEITFCVSMKKYIGKNWNSGLEIEIWNW